MKWKDITKKYNNEWVLVEPKKVGEGFRLMEGKVIAHSKDKSELYARLMTLKGKSVYIEYTGKIPDDLAIVLLHEKI